MVDTSDDNGQSTEHKSLCMIDTSDDNGP
jgi:hypothetical protein